MRSTFEENTKKRKTARLPLFHTPSAAANVLGMHAERDFEATIRKLEKHESNQKTQEVKMNAIILLRTRQNKVLDICENGASKSLYIHK